MKIIPDLFVQNNSRCNEGLLGLEYLDCPIKKVCAYVTYDYIPVPATYCEYFIEPAEGHKEPICKYQEEVKQ